jgi:hypothetical protein
MCTKEPPEYFLLLAATGEADGFQKEKENN